jgi:agmatine deiminase
VSLRLPAEWEEQDGVLLAWPHAGTDWAPLIAAVEPVFARLALEISRREQVLIIAPQLDPVRSALGKQGIDFNRVTLVELPTNDTWTRDFGPITIFENGRPVLLDFAFNGWGLKFACDQDNQATRRLTGAGVWRDTPCRTLGLILEGGSIESDGRGTLLTTAECLLGPNRNPQLDRSAIAVELSKLFGADHWLWLENGYLAGDDTDSHIDTLARLCPDDTILYIACDDPADEHYSALQRMAAELRAFRTRAGEPFRLLPLPWPQGKFDEAGGRLPATYANYLVINGAVLVPTYDDPVDRLALAAIGEAFPKRDIIGIDCSPLILQHGSLHCVTMQLPKGVLV